MGSASNWWKVLLLESGKCCPARTQGVSADGHPSSLVLATCRVIPTAHVLGLLKEDAAGIVSTIVSTISVLLASCR